jgi:hypothetical protein
VELRDGSGAGFCDASENLKPLGDSFCLQNLNYPSRLWMDLFSEFNIRKNRTDRGSLSEVNLHGAA